VAPIGTDQVSARLVAFGASACQPQLHFFATISEHHGVPFSTTVIESLGRRAATGTVVTRADRVHWSPAGHQVVAEALEPFLRDQL